MISDKARANIGAAVFNEKTAAIETHGGFHSHHEAWAVLLEEVEEVATAFADFKADAEKIIAHLWDNVRTDYSGDTNEKLIVICKSALDLACECVQVAAMCDKWGLLLESEAAASEIAK